jgi:hypothetical protein
MSKEKKKSAKEASSIFHNIMAASVKGNPKPNKNMQEKYIELYKIVEDEMKKGGYIKDSLMELCSVSLDRTGIENQINFEFLLGSRLDTKTELKKSFDKHSKKRGFNINYVNLTGDLY